MAPPGVIDFDYLDCWAKTDREGRPALGVFEHCLNVGYVARALAAKLPAPLRALCPPGLATLAGSHDIGKVSAGFQSKSATFLGGLPLTAREARSWRESCGNHAAVTQATLGEHCFRSSGDLARWTIAAGGHHGSFPSTRPRFKVHDDLRLEPFEKARLSLLAALAEELGGLPETAPLHDDHILWATGFITLADWLGSNEDIFPLHSPSADWKSIGQRPAMIAVAETALRELGIGSGAASPGLTFGDLFQSNSGEPYSPNGLQQALVDAASSPGLFIVEAPMGEGKTEAALAAAYSLWLGEHSHGLYFGLPTQLTSERIHTRLEAFLSRAISPDGALLTLVHGSAWLKDDLRVLDVAPASPSPGGGEVIDARRWFTSSRRPLLAPFGIGTIDQALMATMPLKHAGLRLFALSGKTVVLDEIHSFDPYTGSLIDALVARLLKLKCSVVILSATLTRDRRRQLLAAAGCEEPGESDAYPLLSTYTPGQRTVSTTPFSPDPKMRRRIEIETRAPGEDRSLDGVVAAAESGAAVLVVRNTVALAQETHALLKSSCRSGTEVGLLHSRFTPKHREAIEGYWLDKFNTNPEGRGRCILVSTQIVEQSVDIDADLLVSDLAPSDLLIQRLGRLHRHRENDVRRPGETATARLILLDPLTGAEDDAETIGRALMPHAAIYPPYALLRTSARWGELRGTIALPDDIRAVIEDTHAPLPGQVAAWRELEEKQDAAVRKKLNTAKSRSNPLASLPPVDDSEGNPHFGTRWGGQASARIVLCKTVPRCDGDPIVFADGQSIEVGYFSWSLELAKALHLNAVKVPRWQVLGALPDAPDWLGTHINDAALGTLDDGGEVSFDTGALLPGVIRYAPDTGARFHKAETAAAPADLEPLGEDGWF